jgi:hypothetical protein
MFLCICINNTQRSLLYRIIIFRLSHMWGDKTEHIIHAAPPNECLLCICPNKICQMTTSYLTPVSYGIPYLALTGEHAAPPAGDCPPRKGVALPHRQREKSVLPMTLASSNQTLTCLLARAGGSPQPSEQARTSPFQTS